METRKRPLPRFKHAGKGKKEFVQKMFDDISPRYDFLNHFLSMGTDIYWRKKFIRKLDIANDTKILDVACGTGDVCFEILKHHDVSVTGLDISQNMVKLANKKARKQNQDRVAFIHGDGENLPMDSNSVDLLTISYGFRNISNYEAALNEFYRVLKPGGKLGILEFSKPKSKIVGSIFGLYFHHILPRIGSLFSQQIPPNDPLYKLFRQNFLEAHDLSVYTKQYPFSFSDFQLSLYNKNENHFYLRLAPSVSSTIAPTIKNVDPSWFSTLNAIAASPTSTSVSRIFSSKIVPRTVNVGIPVSRLRIPERTISPVRIGKILFADIPMTTSEIEFRVEMSVELARIIRHLIPRSATPAL